MASLAEAPADPLSRCRADAELERRKRPAQESNLDNYLDYLRVTLPSTWSTDPAHIRAIAAEIDSLEAGEFDRLAIFAPPRHGKSESVTCRLPVRWLERELGSNVLVTGYNERFARRFGRRCRNLARERGLCAGGDKAAADEWETNVGGLFMARGVGSPPTGTGFKLIVIDDPVRRREDAESEVYREKVWDWYTDDLYTRLEPGGIIVLVMTHWHHDDLAARAIASEPGRWRVLKLPALAQENDPLGRVLGAALWPERFTVADLGRIRDVLARNDGERSFEALYQQNPTPREGSIFKVSQLEIIPAAPAGLRQVRAWDIGATGGGGSYTVGAKLGTKGDGLFYVLDVVRGQWDTDERDRQIRQTAELDGTGVRQRLPQDPGAAGKSMAAAFVRLLTGLPVTVKLVSGDKETRADPLSSQVNAGNVKLVVGPWNRAFVEEYRAFNMGKFNDQVDAGSDAFTELARPAASSPPRSENWQITG